MDQIGTEPNDGLDLIVITTMSRSLIQIESDQISLFMYNNLALGNTSINCNPVSNQFGIEPNDGLSITGYEMNPRNAQVFHSYRFGSDLINKNKK